jgi:hypothetical protein
MTLSGSGVITLSFSDNYHPQSVSVQRWNAVNAGGDSAQIWDDGESINVSGNTFEVTDDGNDYIYEVYAKWNEGESWYVFSTYSSSPTAPVSEMVYEAVEMRHYTESRGSMLAHPYIHSVRTNKSGKITASRQRGMLAFDKDGKPLQIDWDSLDSDSSSTYFFLYDWCTEELLPGETADADGGWSLNVDGDDPAVEEIAYVLYCDKQLTFTDGTVWDNPDFESWRNTYEGKTVDVNVLESYYPFVERLEF